MALGGRRRNLMEMTNGGRMQRRTVLTAALLLLLASLAAQAQQAKAGVTSLKVGDRAPDFTLKDQNNRSVKLSDFAGKKNVVLAFYVLAFTSG